MQAIHPARIEMASLNRDHGLPSRTSGSAPTLRHNAPNAEKQHSLLARFGACCVIVNQEWWCASVHGGVATFNCAAECAEPEIRLCPDRFS
jgi:hypothetical protein